MRAYILRMDDCFTLTVPASTTRTSPDGNWIRFEHTSYKSSDTGFTWRTSVEVPILRKIVDMELFLLEFITAELETNQAIPEHRRCEIEFADEPTTTIRLMEDWHSASTTATLTNGLRYDMVVIYHVESQFLWQFFSVGSDEFWHDIAEPIIMSIKYEPPD